MIESLIDSLSIQAFLGTSCAFVISVASGPFSKKSHGIRVTKELLRSSLIEW